MNQLIEFLYHAICTTVIAWICYLSIPAKELVIGMWFGAISADASHCLIAYIKERRSA